jgi:hypothetical protein
MSLVPVEPRRPGWVDVMGPAHELAAKLHDTEFVPGRLRKRPSAVMACILAGDEVGIGPMQALRQIFVTDDAKVGMAAELMRSLVLREGHEIWAEDYTVTKVTMAGRRRGQENPSRVTWTIDDAKKAGLLNKQNWSKYPRAMLMARATTELCRLLFADVIAGISYSLEELEDTGELIDEPPADNGQEPTTPTVAKRKAAPARRTRAKGSGPSPSSGPPPPPLPGEDAPPARDQPAPAAKGMPVDQEIAMRAREAGVDHHPVVEAVTFGTKKSAKELTGEEAAKVIEELKAILQKRRRLVTRPGEWPLLEDVDDVVDADIVPDGPPLPGEAEVPADPAQWDGDEWRAFLAAKGVRVGDVLREGHKLAKEEGVNPPTSLGEIHKMPGLAARLHDFVNDLAG